MKKVINITLIILNIIVITNVMAITLQEQANDKLEIYEIKNIDALDKFNGNVVEFYITHHSLEKQEISEEPIETLEEIEAQEDLEPEEPQVIYDINPVKYDRNYEILNNIVEFAKQFVGNPYVYGGTSLTNGADCSGFIQSIYLNFGISLSRSALSQSYDGYGISVDNIDKGDIISYGYDGQVSHSALYIGDGMIIHASTPEGGIRIDSMYIMPIITVRRIID